MVVLNCFKIWTNRHLKCVNIFFPGIHSFIPISFQLIWTGLWLPKKPFFLNWLQVILFYGWFCSLWRSYSEPSLKVSTSWQDKKGLFTSFYFPIVCVRSFYKFLPHGFPCRSVSMKLYLRAMNEGCFNIFLTYTTTLSSISKCFYLADFHVGIFFYKVLHLFV